MALSGTLETFSLPDVLRLLSSTNKTGLLALDGDRGRGRIWVRDGAIVGADADRARNEQIEGVAFELLRFVDARFEFESGAEPDQDGEAHPVDDLLAEAEARLAEWREIESVVPSLDVRARMVADLDGDRTVTAAEWRVLAQIGTGASGHALADRLAEGEYDVCRQLRDLVVAGLVEVDAAPAEEPAAVEPVAPAEEPTFVEPALDPDAVTSLGADLASFVAAGTVEEAVAIDPTPEPELEPVTSPFEAMVDTGDGEDDFHAQLSQLSPKAAAAVEATWVDDEPVAGEPEAPAAEAGPEDAAPGGDDIDQNLLLRFLSSTKQ